MGRSLSSMLLAGILALSMSACGMIPQVGSTAQVEVREVQSRTVASTEVIRINNCGGKGDSKQISERTMAISVEGGFGATMGPTVIQGSVSEKYSQYKSATKRHEMTAPPGTNMEFILKWTEQEWTGTVIANGQSGKYLVHAPLSVEQVSSKDYGDCASSGSLSGQATPAGQKTSTQAPTKAPVPTLKPTQAMTATPSMTILNQKDHYTDQGLEIYLSKVDLSTGGMVAHLILKNNTGGRLLFRFDTRSYYGVDNLGNLASTYIYGCSSTLGKYISAGCGDMNVEAGDTIDAEITLSNLKLANSQVTEVILGILEISRIKNVGFRIQIPH